MLVIFNLIQFQISEFGIQFIDVLDLFSFLTVSFQQTLIVIFNVLHCLHGLVLVHYKFKLPDNNFLFTNETYRNKAIDAFDWLESIYRIVL
jgi:hypothetical protein